MNNPLKINDLIGHGALSRLLGQVQVHIRIEQRLQKLLPAALAAHCHVLAARERTLVLAADSPVWAMRSRFHIPQLQRQLGTEFDTIRVRVLPVQAVDRPAGRRPAGSRSRHSNEALRRAALTVSDPELKSALLRLARNGPAGRDRE